MSTTVEYKVSNLMSKLELGLKTYEGRMLDSTDEANIVEIMENCIRGISDDLFINLMYKQQNEMMKTLLNRAWKNIIINNTDKDLKIEIKESRFKSKETYEERQERIYKQEKDFFFKKDLSVPLCNCGASFTEFPNHHANFCKVNDKVNVSIDINLWPHF